MTSGKKFVIKLVQLIFKIIARVNVTGVKKIPFEETVILTANHIGSLDGLLVLAINEFAYHPNLVVIVAEKYEQIALYKWAVKKLDWMFVDRFNNDVRTLKRVLRQLKGSSLMAIAPEGTRSPNGALIEGKSGAAYLAAKTKATLIPITVVGTEDATVKFRLPRLKRLDITMVIGEPYRIPELPKENRDEFLATQTDEIMCRLAAQLPASHRGIYADHPRLKELLSEG